MSHGDKVTALPPGFKVIAGNAATPIAGMADESRGFYGLQFHPEVTHTLQGKAILGRFVHEICGLGFDWTMPGYVDEVIGRIRSEVGGDHVLLGLSGGVDSSVAAALIHRAIGDQLVCVFVDNGSAAARRGRAGDADLCPRPRREGGARRCAPRVSHGARRHRRPGREAQGHRPRIRRRVPARSPPISAGEVAGAGHDLSGRHRVCGCQHEEGAHDQVASQRRAVCPRRSISELLEPLRELFKDEVRELGIALGLPHDSVFRHPFPGPGLGVRILGEVREEYADLLRRADAIFIEELRASGWYEKDCAGLRGVPAGALGGRDG